MCVFQKSIDVYVPGWATADIGQHVPFAVTDHRGGVTFVSTLRSIVHGRLAIVDGPQGNVAATAGVAGEPEPVGVGCFDPSAERNIVAFYVVSYRIHRGITRPAKLQRTVKIALYPLWTINKGGVIFVTGPV